MKSLMRVFRSVWSRLNKKKDEYSLSPMMVIAMVMFFSFFSLGTLSISMWMQGASIGGGVIATARLYQGKKQSTPVIKEPITVAQKE